jgi:hypothetical protein
MQDDNKIERDLTADDTLMYARCSLINCELCDRERQLKCKRIKNILKTKGGD